MALSKINLSNVGWRAFVDRVVALPDFPKKSNGAIATKATLDQIAVNQNVLIDEVSEINARLAVLDRRPF